MLNERGLSVETQVKERILTELDDPNPFVEQKLRKDVKRYEKWLAAQAKYTRINDTTQEIAAYRQHATQVVKIDDREICTFAPFRPELSALETMTKPQAIALYALTFVWGITGLIFGLKTVAATLAIIVIIYSVNLLLNVIMTVKASQLSSQEQIDDAIVHALKDADWPQYTILCPLYHESAVVPQFIKAMQALDYPTNKLQVLFLTEANDSRTRETILAGGLPAHFHILTMPDSSLRTKPRACNYGLLHATGQYVVIYDAEDIPDPLQLKKAVLTFANHETDMVCVQAKLNCYNSQQNLLTRWYTADYSMWFNLVLPGLQRLGLAVPLGGTSNHFLTAALRILGGWDAYNVTEDCDLGLRLARCHLKTVLLDSTTQEEATSLLKNWLRQRSRWIKGYMQTYLVHMRQPLKMIRERQYKDLFSLHVVVGNRVGILFLNPLMWAFTLFYIVFHQYPVVVTFYHAVFPRPVMYLGLFCLVFGNFFYVYLYLLGCLRQKQYQLMLWALLIPGHWILSTLAAVFALWELVFKPHYWQKTIHGLHLVGVQVVHEELAPSEAAQPPAQPEEGIPSDQISITYATSASVSRDTSTKYTIPTIVSLLCTMQQARPLPSLSYGQKQALSKTRSVYVRDLWLMFTILTACMTSIAACIQYYRQNEVLLYSDAYSHLRIARAVFDSTNPGIAQLGTVWLPLSHVSMFPFIWDTYLWRTGLAGSFSSMTYYVITGPYLYLIMRRLTGNRMFSYLGTLVFLLNANILYLQTTPLSELVCICTMTMACYYFLAWVQEERSKLLVFSGACIFLAVLARYEGWALFLGLSVLIPIISLQRRYRWEQTLGNLVLFGSLAGFGIALWLLWNQVIFGDALAFQRGPFSAQAQQLAAIKTGTLYTYHNLWLSLVTYTFDVAETTSPLLFVLATLGLFLFLFRQRFSPEALAALAFLSIFGFDVLSLYTGQTVIRVPGILPGNLNGPLSNVRYGSEMVGPVALLLTILADDFYKFLRQRRCYHILIQLAIVLVMLTQAGFSAAQGSISLQDGLYGACGQPNALNKFLAQHYDGGKILEDESSGDVSLVDAGIDFKNVIYQGSIDLWPQALAHPEKTVEWIISYATDPQSFLNKRLHVSSPLFLAHFTPIFRDPSGLMLYRLKNAPPLPSRPIPAYIQLNNVCVSSHQK